MRHFDKNYPRIQAGKYYAFSFETSVMNEKKIGDHSYSINTELLWHFRVPPVSI